LHGPHFHVLHSALTKLDNWTYFAEAECYRRLEQESVQLNNEICHLQAERDSVESSIDNSRFQMEAARLPTKVGYLERRDTKQLT
jgi:hypothetical protein